MAVFDAASSTPIGELESNAGRVTAVCVATDGQSAVVGTSTGAITTWDVRSGDTTALVIDGPVPRSCHFSENDQSLVIQFGAEAEVWSLFGPDPRCFIVAPTCCLAGGKTAHI
jgi:WD40 repeat protein